MGRPGVLFPTMQLVPAPPAPADRLVSPKAGAKQRVVEHLLGCAAEQGAEAVSVAVDLFQQEWAAGRLPLDVRAACALLRPSKSSCPDRSTLYRWVGQFRQATAAGSLAPLDTQHQGRQRAVQGWEARALKLYQNPNKPAAAEVARQLREEGQSATETQVRRYLASLPSTALTQGRLGPRLRRAVQGDYVRRTTEGLRAGDIYVGDGHTIDVYLAHPLGRKPWRAELTVWMDVRSRCITGWWLTEAESGLTTLFALSHAVVSIGHVPAMVHVDNGSGYAAQLHTAEATGFFSRLGISPMFALPYNARAKPVERFFLTLEDSFGKRWPSYCGRDLDEEARAAILKRFKKDPAALPTREQYVDGFTSWLAGYHQEEHPEVRGQSRAQVWAASFVATPPAPDGGLWWPRVERVVNRQTVALDNREYKHPALAAFNKTALRDGRVWVEFDVHDDSTVRVLTPEGRWICDAPVVRKRAYVSTSRIEDARAKRETQQVKRLELHIAEVRDRGAVTVDAGQSLRAIEDQTGEVSLLADELARGEIGMSKRPAPADEVELDIWGDA